MRVNTKYLILGSVVLLSESAVARALEAVEVGSGDAMDEGTPEDQKSTMCAKCENYMTGSFRRECDSCTENIINNHL